MHFATVKHGAVLNRAGRRSSSAPGPPGVPLKLWDWLLLPADTRWDSNPRPRGSSTNHCATLRSTSDLIRLN
ncbi:hypothetical protein GN956_G10268 [Arapaima gigas]